MSVRFHKKPVIWVGSIALLAVALIIIFVSLFKNTKKKKEQHQIEKNQLAKIFATLDTIYWKDQDTSMFLSHKAICISKKISDSNALAEALFNKARILRQFGVNDSSFIVSNQALVIAEKMNNNTLIAKIKHNIGYCYLNKDNYYMAMLYYTEAGKIADNLHNDRLIGNADNGLGLVYMALNDFDKAIDYFKRANNAFKEPNRGNARDVVGTLMNIGSCYGEKKDFYRAAFYNEKALTIALQMHDTEMIYRTYVDLGLINEGLGKKSAALNYFYRALEYFKQINSRKMYGIILQNLGAFYFDNNQLIQSEDLFKQSLFVFSKIGIKSLVMKANLALSDIQKQQGQWQKAYQYYARYVEIKDSIFNSETQKKISDYQWEIESQKNKYEKGLFLKKYEIQKRNNIILTISIISVIVLTFLIRRNLKKSVKLQKMGNTHLQEKVQMTEKIKELEENKHHLEMEAKNRKLVSFSLQLTTKNDLLDEISKLSEKYYNENILNRNYFNELTKIIEASLNTDKEWSQFKILFENVHHDFFNKLKNRCSDLTEHELRFCAYIKMNLATKEIARLFNINPTTVRAFRCRLKSKLALDSQLNVEDFLRSI